LLQVDHMLEYGTDDRSEGIGHRGKGVIR
jgi:hypothetical protein